MSLSKEQIRQTLSALTPQGMDQDLVSSGGLQWVATCEGLVSLKLHLPRIDDPKHRQGIAAGCFQALRARAEAAGEPLEALTVEFVDDAGRVVQQLRLGGQSAPRPSGQSQAPQAQPQQQGAPAAAGHRPIGGLQEEGEPPSDRSIPGVKHIVAVGAGKGGVGKSTVAVALAVGLSRRGHAVGLLDGDIYGPSLPTMLGLEAYEQNVLEGRLQPYYVHGIKAITIGKLVDPDRPLIWRGPMAHGAFNQLTQQTSWGELDYLIIDLPPGTGDVPLSMSQSLRLSGAVIVCTPQRVAQDDATRAARMFSQLGVDVLGVVENMSYFVGDDGKVYDIFGRGGAEHMAQRLNLPFLGGVPITMSLRQNLDRGDPSALFEDAEGEPGEKSPQRALQRSLDRLLDNFENQISLVEMRQGGSRPSLSIS